MKIVGLRKNDEYLDNGIIQSKETSLIVEMSNEEYVECVLSLYVREPFNVVNKTEVKEDDK